MRELEKELFEYLKERNWDKQSPVDIAKSVVIEAAERLEIFQWGNIPPRWWLNGPGTVMIPEAARNTPV